jgi:S1-C subfamily serine protease
MQLLMVGLLVALPTIAANVALAQASYGTVFAVAPEIVLTSQYVVDGCSAIEVNSADGRRRGIVVISDADIDLAVVCMSGLKGSTTRLWNPSAVRLGESAMLFGYRLTGALFGSGDFTSGLASALRGLRDAAGEYAEICTARAGRHCSDAQTARSKHSHFRGTVRYFHAG